MENHPNKSDRGTENVPPNNSNKGCVIGSVPANKGVDVKMCMKHDGIVMGGSVTKGKPTPSAGSINKLPGSSTNILG